MTNSTASLIALLLGLGIFLVIVAVGWRSVQNRRIVRMQGADGHETIIMAGEDDEISSIETTTEPSAAPAAPVVAASAQVAEPAPGFGRKTPV
jgi:hypothetical protein